MGVATRGFPDRRRAEAGIALRSSTILFRLSAFRSFLVHEVSFLVDPVWAPEGGRRVDGAKEQRIQGRLDPWSAWWRADRGIPEAASRRQSLDSFHVRIRCHSAAQPRS